jgi:HD-GYP domain-containing protein (c-di-GMP phosphodiesterase class II)
LAALPPSKAIDGGLMSLATLARKKLTDRFSSEFCVWGCVGEWHLLATVAQDSSNRPSCDSETRKALLQQALDDAATNAHSIRRMPNGDLLLAIRITEAGVPMVGITCLPDDAERLLRNLAATSKTCDQLLFDQAESQEYLEEFTEQVAANFEELVWLRGLVEHIELCDTDNSVDEVTSRILPALRELLDADDVIFVASEMDGEVESQRLTRSGSESAIDDRILLRLVKRFRESTQTNAVVENFLSTRPEFSDVPQLQSCVLVTVGKTDHDYGWLLAVNKQSALISSGPASQVPEFGSFEVNPLEAASLMLATHLRNIELFLERERLLIGVIRSMVNALDAKDSYTCGHSDRVALISKRVAQQIGLSPSECEQIYMTGLLHDIGKIGVPDGVLGKIEALTVEEFDEIKKHPAIGYNILKHLDKLRYVLPGVLHHHESLNGSGYPHGLAGQDIPLSARILAVADAYDAMTSSRPYREGMSFEKAEGILVKDSGSHFDADIVSAFLESLDDVHAICADSDEYTASALDETGTEVQAAVAATHE